VNSEQRANRLAVRRDYAEDYILTSLVAFGVTVVCVRVFLQLTGYPQLGNSVLHISHALWGALVLFIAALLPLALANRWAVEASALLSGIGFGLFIDEVGKFITRSYDYFFPPALLLIYGFALLNVLLYLYFRRERPEDPRQAMYHAFEGLLDAIDGDLDAEEAARIEGQLAIAVQSDRQEIASLAEAIRDYLKKNKKHLAAASPGFWKRRARRLEALGRRVGRRWHRAVIAAGLFLWVILVTASVAALLLGRSDLSGQATPWRIALIVIQAVIGGWMSIALVAWMAGKDERGVRNGVTGLVVSLVALQSLHFYLSQFSAIIGTVAQLAFLQILLAYRRWYLRDAAA